MKIVLMSIKPRFAEEILTGVKRFELRAGSGIASGYRVILYASAPIKAVVGEFTSGSVIIGSYEEVEEFMRSISVTGVSNEDFSYIRGKKRRVMAIEVLNPIKYCNPISLEELRRLGLRNPPRSYQFLSLDNPVHKRIIEAVNRLSKCGEIAI